MKYFVIIKTKNDEYFKFIFELQTKNLKESVEEIKNYLDNFSSINEYEIVELGVLDSKTNINSSNFKKISLKR